MTDERFHDVKVRADLAFVDCHRALAELEVLIPHLDGDYLARLLAEADDLHERVCQFAEKAHAVRPLHGTNEVTARPAPPTLSLVQ